MFVILIQVTWDTNGTEAVLAKGQHDLQQNIIDHVEQWKTRKPNQGWYW